MMFSVIFFTPAKYARPFRLLNLHRIQSRDRLCAVRSAARILFLVVAEVVESLWNTIVPDMHYQWCLPK
jgi:hypothetical protein